MKDEMRSQEPGIRSQGTESSKQTWWIFVSFVDQALTIGYGLSEIGWNTKRQ